MKKRFSLPRIPTHSLARLLADLLPNALLISSLHIYETAPNSTTYSGFSSLGGSWN